MSKLNVEPMTLTITVTYNADVFPGDPDDRYEIAALEEEDLGPKIEDMLTELVGDIKITTYKVEPAQ